MNTFLKMIRLLTLSMGLSFVFVSNSSAGGEGGGVTEALREISHSPLQVDELFLGEYPEKAKLLSVSPSGDTVTFSMMTENGLEISLEAVEDLEAAYPNLLDALELQYISLEN